MSGHPTKPPVPLTEDTEQLLELVLAEEHWASAKALLQLRCGSGLPLMSHATPEHLERLRFAVLKLSQGSMQDLSRAIEAANTDWRDVLVAAGFANDLSAHRAWFNERSGA
jgi:hypothetical protein